MTKEEKQFIKDTPTLHKLLEITVRDVAVIKKNRDYDLDVNTWHHRPYNTEKCCVCVAGSIIANTLNTHISVSKQPDKFTKKVEDRLRCINAIRSGNVFGLGIFNPYNLSEDNIETLESFWTEGLQKGNLSSWRELTKKVKEMGI